MTGFTAPESVDSFIARSIGPNSPPYTIVAFEDYMGRSTANYNGPEGRDSYRAQVATFDAEWIASRELAFRGVFQRAYSYRYRREFNGFRPVAGQRLRSAAGDLVQGARSIFRRSSRAPTSSTSAPPASTTRSPASSTTAARRPSAPPASIPPRSTTTPRNRSHAAPARVAPGREGASYGETSLLDRLSKKGSSHRNAVFGVLQSGFFQDRVRTLVGARQVWSYQPIATATPGVETDFRVKKSVPQASVLARLTPEISVYASTSKTFVPQRQVTADIAAIRAAQGDPTSPAYRPPT